MASPALVISYLFLVLVVVVIVVLCCLSCGCHVPMGKCVRCFCSNTTRCCNKLCPRKKGEDKYKSALDQEEGGTKAKAADAKENAANGACAAGCLHWMPFVLSCGYCCGAYKEGESKPPRGGSIPTVVGQPVNATSTSTGAGGIPAIDVDEVMGTDYVVAVKMPLLSIS
mgnify:CR=1 FL=1